MISGTSFVGYAGRLGMQDLSPGEIAGNRKSDAGRLVNKLMRMLA